MIRQHVLEESAGMSFDGLIFSDSAFCHHFIYERLGKKYWPVVMHLGAGEKCCPGCHMSLPPSKLQEAQRNSQLEDDPAKMKTVACDYCGRLVFKK